jgi:hypothetical protein
MDYQKPNRLPKNYYTINFRTPSRQSFLNAIKERCQDKEDPTQCQEKFSKAFDSVFEHLKTKLEEEDRATYIFEKRWDNGHSLDATFARFWRPTGYENWS